jgi:hypothetical protein
MGIEFEDEGDIELLLELVHAAFRQEVKKSNGEVEKIGRFLKKLCLQANRYPKSIWTTERTILGKL